MSTTQVTILGATGSIGASTLSVISEHPQKFEVFALTANTNVDAMCALCIQHRPKVAVMANTEAANLLRARLQQASTEQRQPVLARIEVLSGNDGLIQASTDSSVDQVMAAIVGAAGLAPTLAAVKAGKRVLLANKEALVMSGQLFIDELLASNAQLLPVDSEHNAIFQCLTAQAQAQVGSMDLAAQGIDKILLTGSGGPFLQLPLAELAKQTPAAACNHPNWSMGQKISVDSATMLNKGLEYIEARWLFNCKPEQLEVIIHPQSIIHSMIQYSDGSVLAQMGQADMRTPIAHTMSYPERMHSGVNHLNFSELKQLTFTAPDAARFPCLLLAEQACWAGQSATTALNAANELAVAAFLRKQIGFGDIATLCDAVLQQVAQPHLESIEAVIAYDQSVRETTARMIAARH